MNQKAEAVLGWKLGLARRMKRIDQTQGACAAGVHTQTLSNWERGKSTPSFLQVVALASYYGVSLGWLADPRESLGEGGAA